MQKTFGSSNPQSDQTSVVSDSDLLSKQAELAKREGILEEKERQLKEKAEILDSKLEIVEKSRKDLVSKLEKSSGMEASEAKKILLENVEKDLAAEISQKIRAAEEEIKLHSEAKAREILSEAMRHGITNIVSEFTTSQVRLPDDEMKGRIIGKDGRNIRAFEAATGVDVLMDETPGVLILSSFDPIRREIARITLEKLMADGRIQPERIEELVKSTQEELERVMKQAGENLCHEVEVYNLPADVVAMLGRFKYRYSYGQSLLQHTLEETKIGIEIAKALGADVNTVKLACLLHDIGKVAYDDADEGTHVDKGVQILKKYGIEEKVVNCVAEHHEDKPFSSVESVVAYIADAISGARPGARREDIQGYIKRIEDIEKIATSYEGVEKAYAISAGREVRVVVFPDKVSDDELPKLTHDIAQQIGREVIVPGQIKVTAIRETRATEYALSS